MTARTEGSPLYLFLHQYKTAGTTLWRHLSPNFPGGSQLFLSGERIGLDISKRDGHPAVPGFVRDRVDDFVVHNSSARTRLLMGHFVYPGIHALVPGAKDPRYFTFLRHPVERVVSLYWFLKYASDSFWHHELVDAKEVERWAASLPQPPEIAMMQGVEHFFHGRMNDLRQTVLEWVHRTR